MLSRSKFINNFLGLLRVAGIFTKFIQIICLFSFFNLVVYSITLFF